MIYADNAATTELDIDAYEAMRPFLLEQYGNASQLYSFSRVNKKALRDAREKIAGCIGAEPEEIYFTSGGTESDNWAIKCGAGKNGTIITSSIEHHAVLNACRSQEERGHKVKYLPVSPEGIVMPSELEEEIDSETALVSIMFANNEIGSIQPIKELAAAAHKKNAVFHTDAVQAVGHLPISVHELGIDLLSASAHKFNGPKGIGFLYIRKGVHLESFMDGGRQENGLRAGTENVAAIVAMACALQKNCTGMEKNAEKLKRLEEIVIGGLEAAGIDYRRNGAPCRIPGNVNLSFANMEGEMILHRLDLKGICISTGSACDSAKTEISHVIHAIGVPKAYAEGTIRISFGKNNSEDDAKKIAKELINIINMNGCF